MGLSLSEALDLTWTGINALARGFRELDEVGKSGKARVAKPKDDAGQAFANRLEGLKKLGGGLGIKEIFSAYKAASKV